MKLTKAQRWNYSILLAIVTPIIAFIVLFMLFANPNEPFYAFEFFLILFVVVLCAFLPLMFFYRLVFAIVAKIKKPPLRQITLQDLPIKINSFYDLEALIKWHGQFMLHGDKFERSLKLIEPNEQLYFACVGHVEIKGVRRGSTHFRETAVVLITNKSIVIAPGGRHKYLELSFEDIHSVGVATNILTKMEFCTTSYYVDIFIRYNHETLIPLRSILISAIESTQKLIRAVKVVECEGCAATVLVRLDEVNHCDYCDRIVDNDAPATVHSQEGHQ